MGTTLLLGSSGHRERGKTAAGEGEAPKFSRHTGVQVERRIIVVGAKLSTHCLRSTFNPLDKEESLPRRVWCFMPRQRLDLRAIRKLCHARMRR